MVKIRHIIKNYKSTFHYVVKRWSQTFGKGCNEVRAKPILHHFIFQMPIYIRFSFRFDKHNAHILH